jgi:hypothetical protein
LCTGFRTRARVAVLKCKYPIILVVRVCCVGNEYFDMDNFICKLGKLL